MPTPSSRIIASFLAAAGEVVALGEAVASMPVTLLVSAAEPSCYNRTVNEWWCTAYLTDYRSELVDATVEHLLITISAVLLGIEYRVPQRQDGGLQLLISKMTPHRGAVDGVK